MKKLIIMGLGNAFNNIQDDDMMRDMFPGYEIVALCDSALCRAGELYKNIPLAHGDILSRHSDVGFWSEMKRQYSDFDIFITSKKFYGEIKRQLIDEYGINEENILDIDKMHRDYWLRIMDLNTFDCDGIEVGGPSYIFDSIYKYCAHMDNVNYAGNTLWSKDNDSKIYRRVYINDATDLKDIESSQYDFLLSSNNLEHIANPIRALHEFLRVLKPHGTLVIVVPNKRFNFDHNREDTTFEHIMQDYTNNIDEHDLSHLDEILEKHDLTMDLPNGKPMTKEYFRNRCMKNFENRGMHHHVFSKDLLHKIANELNLRMVRFGDLPDNFIMIAKK